MATSPELGRYRIQAVAQMTGVPAATLRAWERRYGVPTPARTASAYRLYSDRDVELVTRMRDLLAEGIAAAQAAATVLALPLPAPAAGSADAWEQAGAAIVEATRRFDVAALEGAVRQALTLGSAATIYERVLGPTLREVGDLWHAGLLSVAQEHLATQVLESTVRSMLRLVQPPTPARAVVLGCMAEETHTLGLYGAAFHFTGWGYRTVILGARTPPEAVADAVAGIEPAAVGLSMVMPLPRAAARRLLAAYGEACGSIPLLLGGRAAPSLASLVEELGGLCVGEDLVGARGRVEALLATRQRRKG
ncbi:MerR family transcriptional regulator [Vulgatibacter sp.]|uniref:MerR family transcriptional regulator n=1 Tax=Vulgatibacter sp. TaxID=1971226 RepID=UPI003561EB20